MKSIKQIADEANVSKPTVTRAIKELGIHTVQYKNKYMIDESDALLLLNFLGKATVIESAEDVSLERKKPENIETESLQTGTRNRKIEKTATENATEPQNRKTVQEQTIIDFLQEQIRTKDSVIESLLEQNKSLSEQNRALIHTNAYLTKSIEERNAAASEAAAAAAGVNDTVEENAPSSPLNAPISPFNETVEKKHEQEHKKPFWMFWRR